MEAVLRRGLHEPVVRGLFAIEWERLEAGDVRQRFVPPPWAVTRPDGLAGVLALAADSTLGGALSSLLAPQRIPVTQSIRVDVLGVAVSDPTEPLLAHARVRSRQGAVLMATGAVVDSTGTELAVATLRSVVIDMPRRPKPDNAPTSGDDDPTAATSPPGMEPPLWSSLLADHSPAFEVPTTGDMANAAKLVHGGITMMLLEQATRSAAREAGATNTTVASITADFLGPLPCDAKPFSCSAHVTAHRGSTMLASAEATDAKGRTAVAMTVSYRRVKEGNR